MAKINLLPWREELRDKLNKEFYAVSVGCLIIGIVAIMFVNQQVEGKIAIQDRRIAFVKKEYAKLDDAIKEIAEIKRKREQLVERMEVIQNLQGNRSIIVHHFDELVHTVPDGIYFTAVNKKGKKFQIEGVAEANNRVSNLMRNFSDSDWFKDPNLANVKAVDESVEGSSALFSLSVLQDSPKGKKSQSDEEEG